MKARMAGTSQAVGIGMASGTCPGRDLARCPWIGEVAPSHRAGQFFDLISIDAEAGPR